MEGQVEFGLALGFLTQRLGNSKRSSRWGQIPNGQLWAHKRKVSNGQRDNIDMRRMKDWAKK